jgi:hypothetical protein
MYSPIHDGIDKKVRSVRYTEAMPPRDLVALVHCYWELKTEQPLDDDFCLHAMPDACVNVLFNQLEPDIAGVTALRIKYEALNLGKSFHFVGIQFFPGVWRGKQDEFIDHYVGTPYVGSLPLVHTSYELAKLDFAAKQSAMSALVG